MFFPFSRKKAKTDTLLAVEKSIAVELRTFTNHLETVLLSYNVLEKQYAQIIELLKEKKQDG